MIGTPNAAVKQPEVLASMERLSSVVDDCMHSVQDLENKISPVLRMVPTAPGNEKPKRAVSSVHLAEAIDNIVERLEIIRDHTREVIGRVEV